MEIPQYKSGYPGRARRNRTIAFNTGQGEYLIYAALEYRCAIEKVLLNYLALIHSPLPKSLSKLYRASDLKKAILKLEPEFEIRVRFSALTTIASGEADTLIVPDLDGLSTVYGKLGAFLHAVNDPDKTIRNPQWWDTLNDTLDTADQLLEPLCALPIHYFRPNELGRQWLEDYKLNKLSDKDVIRMMRARIRKKG